MNRRLHVPIALACILLSAFTAARFEDVEIETADGFTLRGTYYSSGRPAPGVLLLHGCDGDRSVYDALAESLAREGFHVLTFDYRGHGGSVSEEIGAIAEADPETRRALHQQAGPDVEAAYRHLLAREDVDLERLGVIGYGCGGNRAIGLAARHPEVQVLSWISAPIGGSAVEQLAEVAARPVLLVSDQEDADAFASDGTVFDQLTHPASRRMIYKEGLAGGTLLQLDPDLPPFIAGWMGRRLR